MNIAITADGATLDSTVFNKFAETPYLLIVNVDTMTCTPIAHTCSPGSDEELAQTVLKHRCEAVITGKFEKRAFNVLADDGVTRYAAADMSVRESLEKMDKRQLEFIRNPDGTATCSGDHHH
ncbi:NifB/NifX family molybdenum-iron cluster-binding protein [Desulfogranum marinum]|uniref:NifB/NifX family molybdenum-iron cluster-binding protein n=1 Tax=Desulfogranum marinum TaxID=453220 RepID=UPI0029C94A5A|nr:NifB/NifX family molybdenum-iron cluster-binding protein [Desulfogranum marinum]